MSGRMARDTMGDTDMMITTTLAQQIKTATTMLRTAELSGDARGIRMWTARLDALDAARFAGVGTN